MSQKPIAQARAGMRSLNQSRYIGDYEGAKVTEVDDTQMWLQSGERIVCDLRTRCGHSRDKRRLARVWKTHETDIREQLQFQLKLQLFSLTSALMVARCTVRRGCEVSVSKTTTAATRGHPAVAVVTEVVKKIACC